MEFNTCDISIIIFALISILTTVALFSLSSVLSKINCSCIEAFTVIDFIRSLKKTCPVSFSNKWHLIPLNSGPARCWTKKFQFPSFKSSIDLYGAACSATCSSMYAFSLLGDVSRWGEWEAMNLPRCPLVEPFSEDELKKDNFMHADRVVNVQKGTNMQSYMAMYRFLSFSEKNIKWILFWNSKELEFMFFLIQPAISKTVNCQCVITHLYGSQKSPNSASRVAQRVRNIQDFLNISQLHIMGSTYSPSTPILSTKDSCSDVNTLDNQQQEKKVANTLFALVPVTQFFFRHRLRRLNGFRLVADKQEPVSPTPPPRPNKSKKKEGVPIPSSDAKGHIRRTVSDTCIQPKGLTDLTHSPPKNSQITPHRPSIHTEGSSKSKATVPKQKSLDKIEEIEDTETTKKLAQDCKIRSVSEPAKMNNLNKTVSPQSDVPEFPSDEDNYVNLQVINESIVEENVSCYDKNELFNSSTSDFEVVDSSQQFLNCKLADFLTQGNYGASELQAEMMRVSQYDGTSSALEHAAGGWTYHSTHKGIIVLSKIITGKFIKIVSYLCQMDLLVPPKDIWKCVKNPRFRFMSDETVKTVKIVEKISNTQKLIHVYHETSGLLRRECVDFCLLQTEREELNHYYSSFHSIEYEKCPLMTSVARGVLRPSGYVVEKVGNRKCKVTYLVQILVNGPDSIFVQELNELVPQSLHNLKNYAASKPK